MLNITDVRVHLVKKEESKLKAYVSITLDDCFVIHKIKVIEGTNGCFVAMPRTKNADGEFLDTVHPIDTPTRVFVNTTVLDAYKKAVENTVEE